MIRAGLIVFALLLFVVLEIHTRNTAMNTAVNSARAALAVHDLAQKRAAIVAQYAKGAE